MLAEGSLELSDPHVKVAGAHLLELQQCGKSHSSDVSFHVIGSIGTSEPKLDGTELQTGYLPSEMYESLPIQTSGRGRIRKDIIQDCTKGS
jgi:hypothetical protein